MSVCMLFGFGCKSVKWGIWNETNLKSLMKIQLTCLVMLEGDQGPYYHIIF